MYKVMYNENSIEKINIFTKSYKSSFIRLFEDSGLFMENEIIKNYIKLGDRLHELIFENIDNIFSQETIYGISKNEKGDKFSTLTINNFRLFVYYIDNYSTNTRIIENIEFYFL